MNALWSVYAQTNVQAGAYIYIIQEKLWSSYYQYVDKTELTDYSNLDTS